MALALAAGLVGARPAALPAVSASAGGDRGASRTLTDGSARFEVLTPTLIRMEYADDRLFEDGTTFDVVSRDFPVPRFRTEVRDGWRIIRTAALTLRYREGSGPFTPRTTSISLAVDGRPVVAHPWPDPGAPADSAHNLGGWQRSFDFWSYHPRPPCTPAEHGALCPAILPPLHDGLLSTDGWYLLDDTRTPLWSPGSPARSRAPHAGAVQDGYLFGYGHDYRRALSELARLTGRAPLLPRWMFGVLYSGCCSHRQSDYETGIVPRFRTELVPLDALVVDTQWKSSTPSRPLLTADDDGWSWSPAFFPQPQRFLDGADIPGLHVALNVHPAIEDVDPMFPEADRIAGGLVASRERGEFGWNWGDPRHVESYASLHEPFVRQGVDFWWNDWCCDKASTVTTPGLTPDAWINHLYADDLTRRGGRGFVLARIGASTQRWADTYRSGPWADHRYAVHFTGDTWSTWNTLAFESLMTVREGSIGVAYVSHDIGGYLGPPPGGADTDDLYARWVQFGAFQPVLRLHGTAARLPWEYGPVAHASANRFLRLREALIPYLYTTAREAYDTGVPMVRGLYLDHPDDPEAYRFDHEYMLGDEMLVAPALSPGAVASTRVWFPPGGWTDIFTGVRYQGPAVVSVASPHARLRPEWRRPADAPRRVARGRRGHAAAAPRVHRRGRLVPRLRRRR